MGDPRNELAKFVGLVLKIGAAISSLILLHESVGIPFVQLKSNSTVDPTFLSCELKMLSLGLRRSAQFVMAHCESCTLQQGARR